MNIKSQRGSILLGTLSFIIMLATAAASILTLTMNSYSLSMRNEMRVQARAVAESEMEHLYYQMFTLILADQPAASTPPNFSGVATVSVAGDVFPDMASMMGPWLDSHVTQGWRVARSISYDPTYDSYTGMIPQTTKFGQVTYITVRVVVQPEVNNYFRDTVVVRVGRRFASVKSSIFQYGVFFQGDMELAPGGNILINGDIAANGSIYAAAQASGSLSLAKKVRYLSDGYFDMDSGGNVVLRKPGTPVGGGGLIAPTFLVSQASQLETMDSPENLVGGVDVTELSTRRSDLFPDENDVYRAIILPPPGTETDEYPSTAIDDPTINAQRMYTRAGLRVTVDDTTNTVSFTKPDGTVVTTDYAGVVVGSANTAMADAREGVNVAVTTIDMAALKTAIEAAYTAGPSDFNGSIYFNLKASSASTPRGIKLINGSEIFSRAGKGLTVTTNGGVYIQGNYNTLTGGNPNIENPGDPVADQRGHVPAMIMGDQVTVLSAGWDDANASLAKTSRVASGDIRIQAGILSGNTPASISVASGGVQNLVRYLEMWGGRSVVFFGSMGRLFDSKTFTGAWSQPGAGDVYGSPASRTFSFDQTLRNNPPAGSPTTTKFERGTFFTWQ